MWGFGTMEFLVLQGLGDLLAIRIRIRGGSIGNVQFVCRFVNFWKMAQDNNRFAELLDRVVANRLADAVQPDLAFPSLRHAGGINLVIFPAKVVESDSIEEHDNYGVDFIEATGEITATLRMSIFPAASRTSPSRSAREAMHAVFLYHAIQHGMDMGIVNAGQLAVYDTIEPELREACEDVVLNRVPKAGGTATERMLEIAERFKGTAGQEARERDLAWRELPVEQRISHALVNGITEFIDADTEEARLAAERPLFQDAQAMLKKIIAEKWFAPRGVIGFWPANAVGDDIRLFTDEAPSQELATFFTLRQQLTKRDGKANVALSDFVAPSDGGKPDYISGFIVTAGIEVAIAERFRTGARRLFLDHGQGAGRPLRRGLRRAPGARRTDRRDLSRHPPGSGYPAQPDHTEKATLFRLLDGEAMRA
ncbi:mll6206 [Mesorhizobium japonicum MAFF 303099]|uniref:Mll6206 protein n=1 Tax=Mesorhizobium japonicum (strain LMG 29417 / CECT 9101 / MAFF 303099) TaxID=266835 RepID=Q98A09_RHILO|nr:mll6206 [Mesorhizobium japonicum MAFF 303099]